MELSNGNSQFFHGNNQAFNLIISGHALLLIRRNTIFNFSMLRRLQLIILICLDNELTNLEVIDVNPEKIVNI